MPKTKIETKIEERHTFVSSLHLLQTWHLPVFLCYLGRWPSDQLERTVFEPRTRRHARKYLMCSLGLNTQSWIRPGCMARVCLEDLHASNLWSTSYSRDNWTGSHLSVLHSQELIDWSGFVQSELAQCHDRYKVRSTSLHVSDDLTLDQGLPSKTRRSFSRSIA